MKLQRLFNHLHSTSRRRRERGLTLLEMLVSLGILASVVAGLATLVDSASEDTRASVTALHVKTVGNAASEYIKDNYAAVVGIATATTPALIRIPDLISQGYLPAGYAVTNPRGQATCVLVLEPAANKLTGLVVTEGGDVIDDLTLGKIASTVGGAGGAIYSTDPTTIRGAMGGYSFPVGSFGNPNALGQRCNGTAGTPAFAAGHIAMALWYGDTGQSASTLYRDAVPGNSALNTMNTPILMGAGTVQVEGQACTQPGALGSSSTGGVLSCDGGSWRPSGSAFWKDPVGSFAALPACTAASLNQTRVVSTPTNGTGARAYTCNGAGTWQPLGLDDAGGLTAQNLTVANTATVNNLGGNLQVLTVATEGGGCSPNGRIARDSVGLLLSCQSGLWAKASGSGGGKLVAASDFTPFLNSDAGPPLTRSGCSPISSYVIDAAGNFYSRTLSFGCAVNSTYLCNIASGSCNRTDNYSFRETYLLSPSGVLMSGTGSSYCNGGSCNFDTPYSNVLKFTR